MQEQLFLSDIHLSEQRPEITELFLRFLHDRATKAHAIYILGDLFDAWIGDDDTSPLSCQIRHAFNQLTAGGVRLYIQHGNRDFLLGEFFCQQTGAQLLSEPHCISLLGQTALLLHGDLLCTDDHDYQQARAHLRNPAFINDFLARPLPQRALLAAQYRQRSGEAISLKAQEIMDVNAQAVAEILRQYQATMVIHGHTHRPAMHILDLDGQLAQRIALGAWEPQGAVILTAQDQTMQLESLT